MDLRLYYQKIRDMQGNIAEEFPIIVSKETADGGKDGTKTEVPRRLAAKLVVEGLARLASAEEIKVYRAFMAEGKRLAEQLVQAARVQLTVISTADLERMKGPARTSKD